MAVPAALALGWADPAGAIDFPATGQTTSYPAEKNDHVSAPVAVPDDGAVQAGATLSYTDNGDGTITDDNTGLMWEKKGDNGGLHDKDNGYVWTGTGTQETIWDWLDDVNAEGGTGFAGYDDWRVPNAKELQTLVNFQNSPPMTSGAFNANCVPGATVLTGSCTPVTGYTSSTTWARSTGMAWGVSFYEGLLFPYDKTSGLRVRAVRGGLSGPLPATGQTTTYAANKNDGIPGAVTVPDDGTVQAGAPLSFTDNGNGTLTDDNTGLVWEKKGDNGGLHDKDNFYWWSGNGADETIWDWLEDVNAEAFAGRQDWRIPNARELLSIASFQNQWAVPAAFNNNCVPGATVLTGSCAFQSSYWTSTTRVSSVVGGTSIQAWYVDNYGSVYPYFKSGTFRVRAVRGGTP
ncbi:MAG TPA: DUF1566 domain-containing protein [Thermoanaerobaculia bacterium]|nr:DUF1566 domain-containing protein [Thermoanaerobaculia bacterium]